VDAEAIRTGAVTVQNVAPLAYGDGQVVWGSRNLRFRLMVHLLLWQKSKINYDKGRYFTAAEISGRSQW